MVYFFGYFIGICNYVSLWVLYAIKGVGSCGVEFFLCMALGLVFSSALYFVMTILQFMEVCLVIILWAVILAVFPMFAKSSIHVCKSLWLMGSGGIC